MTEIPASTSRLRSQEKRISIRCVHLYAPVRATPAPQFHTRNIADSVTIHRYTYIFQNIPHCRKTVIQDESKVLLLVTIEISDC
ncbi:hypothetical protein TSAR_004051 [Trichomalopsis sarcophagae]|uniref:Uncharacterized protein n=1 Tax=Trichomalopsis sarcophagae TaxID=543379 RepID=A0A232FML8_9HYME|nr:hypothetical protein TSAR_004051 [Trichomalopsis sarcophagae]